MYRCNGKVNGQGKLYREQTSALSGVAHEWNWMQALLPLVLCFISITLDSPNPRHGRVFHVAGDAIPMSDYTTIVARVAQMMAILLYLNHVIVAWMTWGFGPRAAVCL